MNCRVIVTGRAESRETRREFDAATCMVMERLAQIGRVQGFHDAIDGMFWLEVPDVEPCVNIGAVRNAVSLVRHVSNLTFRVE